MKGDVISTAHPYAWTHLFKVGLQYYIAGRAAARGHLAPVAGNLLHHSVEMVLKGELSKTVPLEEIKQKYGHNLVKTWGAFKALHASENLSVFDQLIADLDRFEKIRYPDEYLKHGALMSIGWSVAKPAVSQVGSPMVPEYCLYVNEVDALIARLINVCCINPQTYWGVLPREALRFLQYENNEYDGWRLPRPVLKQE